MRIRLRHPEGVSTITIEDSATVGALRHEIVDKSGLHAYEIKRGYPPVPLDLDAFNDTTMLADTGIKFNGEQLILVKRDVLNKLRHPVDANSGPPDSTPQLPSTAALTASREGPTQSPFGSTNSLQDPEVDAAQDSPEVAMPSHGGTLVLRVMPDDNSCLFRALSYVTLGPGIDSMHELRRLVASTIAAKPDTYSDVVLGKPREQYCEWIQTEASWGGYVELSILAQHFDVEVSSVNVQDGRVDRYNEGSARRCILVYSGIHYDAVSLSPADRLGFGRNAAPEDDTKVFESSDEVVLASALDLCKLLRERHYYTDTAHFTVKCNICGWTGNGEKGATEHAMATGHMDYGES